jgi:hypothetical protein
MTKMVMKKDNTELAYLSTGDRGEIRSESAQSSWCVFQLHPFNAALLRPIIYPWAAYD